MYLAKSSMVVRSPFEKNSFLATKNRMLRDRRGLCEPHILTMSDSGCYEVRYIACKWKSCTLYGMPLGLFFSSHFTFDRCALDMGCLQCEIPREDLLLDNGIVASWYQVMRYFQKSILLNILPVDEYCFFKPGTSVFRNTLPGRLDSFPAYFETTLQGDTLYACGSNRANPGRQYARWAQQWRMLCRESIGATSPLLLTTA